MVTMMVTIIMMASLLGDWKITVKGPVEKQVKRLCHKHGEKLSKDFSASFVLRSTFSH